MVKGKGKNQTQPEFVDNLNDNTLEKALQKALASCEGSSVPDIVRIVSAFFSPSGFFLLASQLAEVEGVKILLGADPFVSPQQSKEESIYSRKDKRDIDLKAGLRKMNESLIQERDTLPFHRSAYGSLAKLVKALRSNNIEVRRYEKEFLHAKAYIISSEKEGKNIERLYAGSSNFTKSGLTSNYELNLGLKDEQVFNQAIEWYDRLWEEAVPFDLAEIYEDAIKPRKPWEIFLRVLWQLYGAEIEEEERIYEGLPLTEFQKHGVYRALRLIKEYGGAMIADEVGLGKTFIAGEILNQYVQRRQRALIVCPAALRDSTWKKFITEHQLFVECLSFGELANDVQLRDPKREAQYQEHLDRQLDEYQLVIVDEAHNYRNPTAPTRALTLRRMLYGRKRDLLLLTATPVNNSLWDLYYLLRFFLRQDGALVKKGILSIREKFATAMKKDLGELHPDDLYPIIDATTLKRTRQFIKKHYSKDTIIGPDKTPQEIVFPNPVAATVRYGLGEQLPGYFDLLERALEPEEGPVGRLSFSRYTPYDYISKGKEELVEEITRGHGFIGLLRTSLLKRFESSIYSFQQTIEKMEKQHILFLRALSKGRVIYTKFLNELSSDDENVFEDMLMAEQYSEDADLFDSVKLQQAVTKDLEIIRELIKGAKAILPEKHPKLKALSDELVSIVHQAEADGLGKQERVDMRKVLVFSQFADTVHWINEYLEAEVQERSELSIYKGKTVAVSGTTDARFKVDHKEAAERFAPITMEKELKSGETTYDLMITTDVLAEGVNLQQCRNIINFDVPWNPMRLVQRHGRIDRIGSSHSRVFLRTFFPGDRLEDLLRLKERIMTKLALAAASIGEGEPVEGVKRSELVFSETREEIEKLLNEDASIFERGGTVAAAQSGEEYRQTLREALANNREKIVTMPWKVGSGMKRGSRRGVIFCAVVGLGSVYERTLLRFVQADKEWQPFQSKNDKEPIIDGELGSCLRMLECEPDTEAWYPESFEDDVFDFWEIAKQSIYKSWMYETDPANLHPSVSKMNLQVAEYIRNNFPSGINEARVSRALDILEAPWPYRDRAQLKEWYENEDESGKKKSEELVNNILDTGLEPIELPPPLPIIDADEHIELLCWMAIEPEQTEDDNSSPGDSEQDQPEQSETTD